MPTVQQIINTVNATYRNTFTDAQKLEWMDTTQRQIYRKVKHESEPYGFATVYNNAFYPLPTDCDPMGIKTVSIETKEGSGKYKQLRFVSSESNQLFSEFDELYSVQGDEKIFINPLPTTETEGKNVIVVYNKRPAAITSLIQTPDLDEDFHELLVLGVCERIARARMETEDKSNFANDFALLLRDYERLYKHTEPEYKTVNDVLPKRRGGVYRRGRTISDLIPE